MRYKPSLPENNDNVSHNHPLREFFILLSGLLTIILVVFWSLGLFVDFAVDHITPENEAALFSGIDFTRHQNNDVPTGQEAVLQNIANSLQQCTSVPYPVTVKVIKSEHANAGAYPGGTIVVFTGLFKKLKSMNGLAFVMAHELGHYMNRDHLRTMGRGIVILALSTAITGVTSDISRILTPATDFGHATYSQKQESAADETALQALNCFYGHVGGAAEFFEAIMNEEKLFNNKAMHYFASHPEIQRRIDDLNRLAISMGLQSGDVVELPSELLR